MISISLRTDRVSVLRCAMQHRLDISLLYFSDSSLSFASHLFVSSLWLGDMYLTTAGTRTTLSAQCAPRNTICLFSLLLLSDNASDQCASMLAPRSRIYSKPQLSSCTFLLLRTFLHRFLLLRMCELGGNVQVTRGQTRFNTLMNIHQTTQYKA